MRVQGQQRAHLRHHPVSYTHPTSSNPLNPRQSNRRQLLGMERRGGKEERVLNFWHDHSAHLSLTLSSRLSLSPSLLFRPAVVDWGSDEITSPSHRNVGGGGGGGGGPNQQRTLNKLPTELRRRSFVAKHQLSMQIGTKRAKMCNVYMFRLSFHFAYHRWWLGRWMEEEEEKNRQIGGERSGTKMAPSLK